MSYSKHRPKSSGVALTRRDVDQMYGTLRDAKHALSSRDPAKSEGKAGQLVGGLESAGAALAVGVAAGRFGTTDIPGTGIPLGLSAAAAGFGALLLDWVPEKLADHVQSLAQGSLDGFVALWGLGQGQSMAEAAGAPTGTVAISGAPPARVGHCGPTCPPEMSGVEPRAAMPASGRVRPNVKPWTEAEIAAFYARQ